MDTQKLVTHLGGEDRLSQRLRDRGLTRYSRHAVIKWKSRGLPDCFSLRAGLVAIVVESDLPADVRDQALAVLRRISP